MAKTTQKNQRSTKTTAKAKTQKPIISTGKKIGLTIYFTFIFTLMGVMGLQIWLNGPNGLLSNESLTAPQQTTQQSINDEPNDQTINNTSQNTPETNWQYNNNQTTSETTDINNSYLNNESLTNY